MRVAFHYPGADVFFACRVAQPRPVGSLLLASEALFGGPATDPKMKVIVVRITSCRLVKNPSCPKYGLR